VAQSYGVLREHGMTERAIFIVDKQGVIRYIDIHDFSSQPDNQVLFEVLEGLE
jgi:alkyl hydroperoxide reductase subunit AhpC